MIRSWSDHQPSLVLSAEAPMPRLELFRGSENGGFVAQKSRLSSRYSSALRVLRLRRIEGDALESSTDRSLDFSRSFAIWIVHRGNADSTNRSLDVNAGHKGGQKEGLETS